MQNDNWVETVWTSMHIIFLDPKQWGSALDSSRKTLLLFSLSNPRGIQTNTVPLFRFPELVSFYLIYINKCGSTVEKVLLLVRSHSHILQVLITPILVSADLCAHLPSLSIFPIWPKHEDKSLPNLQIKYLASVAKQLWVFFEVRCSFITFLTLACSSFGQWAAITF